MEVAVPRFGACTRARDIDTAIASAFSVLGYDKPTRVQEESINDQGVCVGTGSGKSLFFLALPLVYDCLSLPGFVDTGRAWFAHVPGTTNGNFDHERFYHIL